MSNREFSEQVADILESMGDSIMLINYTLVSMEIRLCDLERRPVAQSVLDSKARLIDRIVERGYRLKTVL